MAGVFKKNDIRGVVGEQLTFQFAAKLGYCFVKFLNTNNLNIAIAGDTRLSTPNLIQGLTEGITKAGANIYDMGVGPTPMTYFATANNEIIDQAIMVTGSHNPPNQNGIKISNSEGQSYHYDNLFEHLENLINEFDTKFPEFEKQIVTGKIKDGNYLKEEYFEYLGNSIEIVNKINIIVDYGKGATGDFSKVLKKLGINYKELGNIPDGSFNGNPPDPAKPETFNILKENISDEDIAIAFDTDGDRVGFMTVNREILSPDQITMLYADVLKEKKDDPTIIIDVKVSKATAKYIDEIGGKVLLSQVGHSYIHEKILEQNAEMAAELSGHYYFNDRYYGFDDGLYAAIRFIEIIDKLKSQNKTLEDRVRELPRFNSTPEFRDEISYQQIDEILAATLDHFSKMDTEISQIDGLRIELNDGWFLMRKSGTEEILSYRVEGNTPEARDSILESLKLIISKYT